MNNPLILLIETATTTCSVALSENGNIIAAKEVNERNVHASHITLFIQEVMQQAGRQFADLNAVAISKGPGSYTGLRIGVSSAKGLCYALDIPLIGVDTVEAMASGLLSQQLMPQEGLLIPMIDARRMEVYTGIFDKDLTPIEAVSAKIVDEGSFVEYADRELYLFGDGADKFKEVFAAYRNIHFVDFSNSATNLNELALSKYLNDEKENLAYFEPFYLKDFLVTKSRK